MNSPFRADPSCQSSGASSAQNGARKEMPSASSDFYTLSTVSMSNMTEGGPCVQAPSQPKKKRIRRQKLELEYLRKLVVSLEEQMSMLKAKPAPRSEHRLKETVDHAPSIWKRIAERQLKERTRVEEKNQKLRSSLKGQIRLAKKLEGLLHKRPLDEETEILADSKRLKPFVSTSLTPTDDEIFADQMAHVQLASSEVDRIFGTPEFVDQSASFYKLQVMNDSNSDTGVAFVKKASSLIPFDIKVTEKALWRALAEEGTKKDSYFLDERLTTDNVEVCSYGLHFRVDNFHANVLGKQTYRRCVADDRVVIMWKWVVDPVEVNGTKFRGIRCHETGWIVLRGVSIGTSSTSDFDPVFCNVPSNSVTSTKLLSYSKMTMELQDDITDQDLQVGALTNFVVNLHDTLTEVCGKMITNVLVEEDWNVNGWWGLQQS